MSILPPDHQVWQRLASGGLEKLQTSNLGIQLMATRLRRTSEPLAAKAQHIHAFFAKWERTLPAEIAQLSRL